MLDFAVVGAGPVGLLCAVALRRLGRTVTVLERCRGPRAESRSIGIHAASLAGLDGLSLLEPFLARGVRIEHGIAVGSRGLLGTIDLGDASARYGFALAIPQSQTEALLARAGGADGVRTLRGAEVVGLARRSEHVELAYTRDGSLCELAAQHVLGCDGAHGEVREWLGIGVDRHRLSGSYMMAEFPGTPTLGTDAWIFLADQGLVESFPLPDNRRRWVVEVQSQRERVDLDELCGLIGERCGLALDPRCATEASAFGVAQALVRRMRSGRVALLGDAAHTLSPFGAQGMNLGWLDAFALADVVAARWTPTGVDDTALDEWARRRHRAARVALRRAAWNTRIGHRPPVPWLRNALVRVGLSRPFAPRWSRRIAMLSLASRPLRS